MKSYSFNTGTETQLTLMRFSESCGYIKTVGERNSGLNTALSCPNRKLEEIEKSEDVFKSPCRSRLVWAFLNSLEGLCNLEKR